MKSEKEIKEEINRQKEMSELNKKEGRNTHYYMHISFINALEWVLENE